VTTGRWLELEQAWHDTDTVQCMVCGRLIPRHAWLFEGGAGELRACGPECQSLYESYWRPTYGTMEPDAHH
jgi:hypothetical protein